MDTTPLDNEGMANFVERSLGSFFLVSDENIPPPLLEESQEKPNPIELQCFHNYPSLLQMGGRADDEWAPKER